MPAKELGGYSSRYSICKLGRYGLEDGMESPCAATITILKVVINNFGAARVFL